MTSLQRDPNRYCASVYMPIPLAVKIKSVIEGEFVERKTRACIHGKKRRKDRTPREKTIGDFLVDIASVKTLKVKPTAKAKKWGDAVLKKNLRKRKEADMLQKCRGHR